MLSKTFMDFFVLFEWKFVENFTKKRKKNVIIACWMREKNYANRNLTSSDFHKSTHKKFFAKLFHGSFRLFECLQIYYSRLTAIWHHFFLHLKKVIFKHIKKFSTSTWQMKTEWKQLYNIIYTVLQMHGMNDNDFNKIP